MTKHTKTSVAACHFLEALSDMMQRYTARQTAQGNPSAPTNHFKLMTLHNRLTAIPRDSVDQRSYKDNIAATIAAYKRYLGASGQGGTPAVDAMEQKISHLLDQYMPPDG